MQYSERRNITRWIIITTSFVIVSLILLNTYSFFQIFKNEERHKMELWAQAQTTLINSDLNADTSLPLKIIQKAEIPIFFTSNNKTFIKNKDFSNFYFKLEFFYRKKILKKIFGNEDIKFYDYSLKRIIGYILKKIGLFNEIKKFLIYIKYIK